MEVEKGQVRVGIRGVSYPGFTEILVLMKSSKYGAIGPYELRDEKGRCMEGIWQFSKCYEDVPRSVQKYSKYDSTVIWDHPAEKHVEKNGSKCKILPAYFAWREKGMNAPKAIRYPVGYNHRHKCLFALAENPDGTINKKPLNYVESRKEIYVKVYCKLVEKHKMFIALKKRLEKGENLLIVEVDGPHPESLEYYKDVYGVDDTFIERGTMLCNEKNLDIMLNDTKHAFGHCFCLASSLLEIDLCK